MNGYDAYCMYQALKLHFTVTTYDYFKYNKKTRCSVDTFDKRRDKYTFHRLAKKYPVPEELESFLAASFFMMPKLWVGDLFSEEAVSSYSQRRKIKESFEYSIREDLYGHQVQSLEDLRKEMQVHDGEYPPLLLGVMQHRFQPETLIGVDLLTQCLDTWEGKISDTIIYPALRLRLRRYAPFLHADRKQLAHSLRLLFGEAK